MDKKPATVEIHCDTAQEFLKCISPFGRYFFREFPSHKWIFRGHGDSSFHLTSTALREELQKPLLDTSAAPLYVSSSMETAVSQVAAEYLCLFRFIKQLDNRGLSLPLDSESWRNQMDEFGKVMRHAARAPHSVETIPIKWPPDFLLPVLALARHQGIPTRLLDWSRDPMIAAYFAASAAVNISSSNAGTLDVWAFETITPTPKGGVNIDEAQKSLIPLSLVHPPSASNINMRAQRGVFTLIKVEIDNPNLEPDRKPLNERVKALEESGYFKFERPLLWRFSLASEEAGKLLWLLAKNNIDASYVLPSYFGAAQSLLETSNHIPVFPEENDAV